VTADASDPARASTTDRAAPDDRLVAVDDPFAAAGRRRRLRRLAGPDGIIAGIALDHRDSLRVVLERQGSAGRTIADLRALKHVLVRVLAPAATVVMLDAELGRPALEDGSMPASVGLIMPLEAQGYETQGDRRLTTLLDDFSPLDALRIGADACKILLPYRIDDEPAADRQDALVAATVAACHAIGLPLVVEPVVHRLSTETEAGHAAAYRTLVVEGVARLQPLGADLLKLPFPMRDPGATPGADASAACRALAAACRDTPWVLLGGGDATGIDGLVDQIRMAGEAGASGFLAGRAIWGPTLRPDARETARLASETALPAFLRCRTIATAAARPLPSGPG
jgi:tagatose-1,6-bisphosphate aldolase